MIKPVKYEVSTPFPSPPPPPQKKTTTKNSNNKQTNKKQQQKQFFISSFHLFFLGQGWVREKKTKMVNPLHLYHFRIVHLRDSLASA